MKGRKGLVFGAAVLAAFLPAAPLYAAATGALAGHVVDSGTGDPVPWATVVVEGINHGRVSDTGGYFLFPALTPGVYTLQTLHLGYRDARFEVRIEPGDTTRVDLRIGHEPLHMDETVVEEERGRPLSPLHKPEVVFSGSKLRQNLSRTIAETMDYEPGVAQRTMGPAPARPVLRGLSGDRLLVLEDGERTGDLSASCADHAVAIEPMTTERIEVVRGPGTMLYGSNALGGVVNVVRGYVPSEQPQGRNGSFTWQAESVTGGLSAGLAFEQPLGPLAMRFDSSLRNAGEVATPRGPLVNTDIRTGNGSLGVSLVRPWGHLGVSGSLYDSEYGIPPDPEGGHPLGISILLERQHLESRAGFRAVSDRIRQLELHHTFSRYQHGEFEANGSLGLEFGLLTHHLASLARLNPVGPFDNGAAGVWYEYRNYAAAGLNFTPPTTEYAGAWFTYQELKRGDWAAKGAVRFDVRRVQPREERYSNQVGRIQRRDFAGLSGGLSAHFRPVEALTLGTTLMRTFRPPGLEELFSEGPHLAAYSYEVGNGALDSERGRGIELFADYRHTRGHLRLAVYHNDIDGFIFPRNTGMLSPRRADLFLYRTVGERVDMRGAEIALDWDLWRSLKTTITASQVRGVLSDRGDEPLPRLPPMQGRFSLTGGRESLSGTVGLRLAAAQDRPGEFEEPTDGYAVLDLSGQYLASWGGRLHAFSATLENATNAVYRRHLNRVKEILPEPGRNLRVLHKLYF